MSGDRGVPASPSGCQPTASAAVPASSQSGIPNAGIGITGTRNPLRRAQHLTLTAYLTDYREAGVLWQHNGDCVGADLAAGEVWRSMGGKIDLHPPKDGRLRAFQKAHFEREAQGYTDRNESIVGECALLLALPLGFHEELRSGTWATIRYARRHYKPLIIIWPDGNATVENGAAQGIVTAHADETRSGSVERSEIEPGPVRDAPETPIPDRREP